MAGVRLRRRSISSSRRTLSAAIRSLHLHSRWSAAGSIERNAAQSTSVSGRKSGSPAGARLSGSARIFLAGAMMMRIYRAASR